MMLHKMINKKLISVFLFLGLVGIMAAPQAIANDNEDISLYLNEARLGKWTEDYDRLLRNYKKVLKLEPEHAEAEEALRETYSLLRSSLKPQFAFYGDSEGLEIDSYGTNFEVYPAPATRLDFLYSFHSFSQDERSADKHSYRGKINHRISSMFSAGFTYEYNDYDKAPDSQTFSGDLYCQLSGTTAVYLAFSRHNLLDVEDPFSIYGWNVIGGIDSIFEDIGTNDYTGTLIHKFSEDVRYLGSFTFGDYTDGNEKKTAYNELDWRFWKPSDKKAHGPEWHFKYSHFLLDYSKPSPFYWSPNFFNAHSWVLQVAGKVADRLTYMVESGVSYSPENSDVGYRVVSKVAYEINEDLSLEGSAFYFEEGQVDRDEYWAKKFTVAFTYRF